MNKSLSALSLFLVALVTQSHALADDPHYSNVKITEFKVGVDTNSPLHGKYFCVKLQKTDFNKKACVTEKYGASNDAFDVLYSMSYSSYLSRASVKAYIIDHTFNEPNFVSENSANMLTNLVTCNDSSSCF